MTCSLFHRFLFHNLTFLLHIQSFLHTKIHLPVSLEDVFTAAGIFALFPLHLFPYRTDFFLTSQSDSFCTCNGTTFYATVNLDWDIGSVQIIQFRDSFPSGLPFSLGSGQVSVLDSSRSQAHSKKQQTGPHALALN